MKHMNTMRFAAHAFGRGVRVMAAFDVAKARTRCQELSGQIRAVVNFFAQVDNHSRRLGHFNPGRTVDCHTG